MTHKLMLTFSLMLAILAGCAGCGDTGESANDDDSAADAGLVVVVDDDDSAVSDDDDSGEPSPITWTDCGGAIGEKACDFTYTDQNGDEWNLYDQYGTVMILDFSTVWCGVCKNLAPTVQMHQDTYTALGHNFLWVTVLVDGPDWGVAPTHAEVAAWATDYGMTTSPVLGGDRNVVDTTAENGYPITGWPTFVIVDETLTIRHGIIGWDENLVMTWLESVLNSN